MTGSDDTTLYPMRVVTQMTGLKSDTIRAWERRYQAIQPERSDGNTRKFSPSDVQRLNLLKTVTQLGHPISAVASMSSPDLQRLVDRQAALQADPPHPPEALPHHERVTAYINAIHHFDIHLAVDILHQAQSSMSQRDFVFDVVTPIVDAVEASWHRGDMGVAHEHLVRDQLTAICGALEPATTGGPKLLLATPAGHRQELGLLADHILCRMRGFDVLSVGTDLPQSEIETALKMSEARVCLMRLTRRMTDEECQSFAQWISHLTQHALVWIGCDKDHPLNQIALEATLLHDDDALDARLLETKATA